MDGKVEKLTKDVGKNKTKNDKIKFKVEEIEDHITKRVDMIEKFNKVTVKDMKRI